MPLVTINAGPDGPDSEGDQSPDDLLARALDDLAPGAPVVVLIHGYKYSPSDPVTNPHTHILSLAPRKDCRKAVSWPKHLGFGRGRANEGLCIAFGWEARGTIWRAWAQAEAAGAVLATLVRLIRNRHAGPVDMVAHSLGARVALSAVQTLPAHSVGRVLLMAGAEFRTRAAAAMASPAGRTAEIVNVTSRENDIYDLMTELLLRPPARGDRALGAGLPGVGDNWLDLQMDCEGARAGLAGLGYRIPAPERRICHWSAYLRPGLFGLYTDLLRRREAVTLEVLRAVLPDAVAPRWSRLADLSDLSLPLPTLPRLRT